MPLQNQFATVFETSAIFLSKDSLKSNLNFIRNHIGQDRKLSCVVKGNAYGHGIEQYVPLAETFGVDHFAVYSTDEAQRVCRVKSIKSEVMIMGAADDAGLKWAIENGVEFWVFDFVRLDRAIATAKAAGIKAKIHIELETGMHRTGFEDDALKPLIKKLKSAEDHIDLKGICTHFAGAESITNYYRITAQIKAFKKLCRQLSNAGIKAEYKHTCCSAAALRFPEMMLDMVRVGILQYGFWPSTETFIAFKKSRNDFSDPLKRLITWQSKLMNVKHIKAGEYIGYGTSYLTQRDIIMGIVPVGYGHGFTRSLSNQGRALVKGTRVAVIGTVNMNCLALDLTDVSNPKKGDEVTLIGHDGELEVSVASFSEASNQLNYELLTRLPMDIPRKIL